MTVKVRTLNQRGIASIIVVFIITILISLVSLGFARLMDRALRNVSNNQLGAAADYAAQSGLNDAIAYVKGAPSAPVTDCQQLMAAGQPLEKKYKLTTDGNTQYSCILINPVPGDLAFQNLAPYKSQVVKLASSDNNPLTSVMFSWKANTNSPAKNNPAPGGNPLLTEIDWGNANYPPLLRVTLYPISTTTVPSAANSHTYFLYPSSAGGSTVYSAASGSIVGGNCNNAPVAPYTSSYQCNTVINGLDTVPGMPTPDYYVARITPLYVAADVGVQARTASGVAKFADAQTVIDVTGKSNSAVKRIQARVALAGDSTVNSGDNGIPEDAIRSAFTICKRLIVPTDPAFKVYVDPNSPAVCNFFTSTIPPPTVDLKANNRDSITITAGDTINLTWTSTNAVNCDGTPWTNSTATNNTSPGVDVTPPGTITYTITCTGPTGLSNSDSVTVTVNPPVPVVTLSPASATVTQGTGYDLTWNVTNNPTSCTQGGPWAPPQPAISPLSGGTRNVGSGLGPGTYTYTLQCSNAGGSSNIATSVLTVNPPGSPPPPPPGPPGSPPPPPPPPGGGGSCLGQGNNGQPRTQSNDPCIQYLTASRIDSSTIQIRFRADGCSGALSGNYGWSGPLRATNGPDPEFSNVTVGSGSGTFTMRCNDVPNNFWSVASVSFSAFSGGPPPCTDPPGCPATCGGSTCPPPPTGYSYPTCYYDSPAIGNLNHAGSCTGADPDPFSGMGCWTGPNGTGTLTKPNSC